MINRIIARRRALHHRIESRAGSEPGLAALEARGRRFKSVEISKLKRFTTATAGQPKVEIAKVWRIQNCPIGDASLTTDIRLSCEIDGNGAGRSNADERGRGQPGKKLLHRQPPDGYLVTIQSLATGLSRKRTLSLAGRLPLRQLNSPNYGKKRVNKNIEFSKLLKVHPKGAKPSREFYFLG